MTDVLLCHHAQGLTDGVHALADDLRAAGHTVHLPDLYDGRTFDDLEEGVGHAEQEIGFDAIVARGALLLHSSVPPQAVGGDWPAGVPAQIHAMEDDAWDD